MGWRAPQQTSCKFSNLSEYRHCCHWKLYFFVSFCLVISSWLWTSYFRPGGTPNTRDLVMQMTKKVDNPRKKIDSEEKGEPVNTLYDNMMFRRSTDGVVNYPSGESFRPFSLAAWNAQSYSRLIVGHFIENHNFQLVLDLIMLRFYKLLVHLWSI